MYLFVSNYNDVYQIIPSLVNKYISSRDREDTKILQKKVFDRIGSLCNDADYSIPYSLHHNISSLFNWEDITYETAANQSILVVFGMFLTILSDDCFTVLMCLHHLTI